MINHGSHAFFNGMWHTLRWDFRRSEAVVVATPEWSPLPVRYPDSPGT